MNKWIVDNDLMMWLCLGSQEVEKQTGSFTELAPASVMVKNWNISGGKVLIVNK